MSELGTGEEIYRLQLGEQAATGRGPSEFCFVFTGRAQTPDDCVNPPVACEVNGQPLIVDDLDLGFLHCLSNQCDPLRSRAHGTFGRVLPDSHDYLVENFERSTNEVDVTEGDRIERSGIECGGHEGRPVVEDLAAPAARATRVPNSGASETVLPGA